MTDQRGVLSRSPAPVSRPERVCPWSGEETCSRGLILDSLCFCIARLLDTENWRSSITEVLESIGVAIGASRVYLFQNRRQDNQVVACQIFEWAAPGIAPRIDNEQLKGQPYQAGFERWPVLLSKQDLVVGVIREFPESERSLLQAQGIQSIAVAPIFVKKEWWGFVGFDDCLAERKWSDAELDSLRIVARTLGAVIVMKQTQQALESSEEKYRTVADHTLDWEYWSSANGEILYMSPSCLETSGYSREDFIKNHHLLGEIVHPADVHRWEAHLKEEVNQANDCEIDYRIVRADGQERWLAHVCRPVFGADGRPLGRRVGLRDFTARKAAEEALRKSENKYRLLMEQAAEAILLLERSGRIVDINERGCRLLGMDRGDLLQENILRFRERFEFDFNPLQVEEVLAGKTVFTEGRVFLPENQIVDVESSGKVLPDGNVLVVLRDQTERRRLEREILEVTHRQQQQIGRDLHDVLGQNLVGINFLASLTLQKAAAGLPEISEDLRQVVDLVRRSIEQTRALAQGLCPIQWGEQTLSQALSQLAENTRLLFGVPCVFEQEGDEQDADEHSATHLYLIAREALNNAVKHSGTKNVKIRLRVTPDWLELTVEDDGKGFVKEAAPSQGLGVHIMDQRARLLHGTLEIAKRRPCGTLVRCTCPKTR